MTLPMPTLPSLCRAAALGLLLISLGECGTAAPAAPPATAATPALPPTPAPNPIAVAPVEPTFTPPVVARSALVGSMVTVAPNRIVGDLDALSQRLRLPMLLGQALLSSLGDMPLVGENTRFQQVWDRLDPGSPIAVVWVLPPKSQAKGYCAALTFKDSAGARRTLDEMGAPGKQVDGISLRRSAGGDQIWGGIKGRKLFVSGSAEALLFAGGLAEAAQVSPGRGQVVLTVLPQALAATSGQSPDAIVAHLASLMASQAQTGEGKATPAIQRLLVAITEAAAKLVMESTAVHLFLDVGPNDGAVVQVELVPGAGTEFAAQTAHRAPYAFDTRLPVGNDGTAVLAIGEWGPWMARLTKMFEATGPAGRATWRDTSKVFEMTGEWSCVVDVGQAGFSTLCSSALKPGTSSKAGLDAAVAMMKSQHAWEADLDGRKVTPLKIKRARDVVEIEKKIENREPKARAMARAFAGGDTIKYALSVKDGRLLQAAGGDALKALSRYGTGGGTGGSTTAAPLLSATLARTKGDEMVASVDVISFALRVLGRGKDLPGNQMAIVAGAMPGMAEMTAPFAFALRGGNSLVGELRIPLGSLESVANVVRGMLGAPGAPSSH